MNSDSKLEQLEGYMYGSIYNIYLRSPQKCQNNNFYY